MKKPVAMIGDLLRTSCKARGFLITFLHESSRGLFLRCGLSREVHTTLEPMGDIIRVDQVLLSPFGAIPWSFSRLRLGI